MSTSCSGWGRDFGDVTPLRGVILGGGEQTLSVEVDSRGGSNADVMQPKPAADVWVGPMSILNVIHRTRYSYSEPVSFGPHRLMMRPRDSHDLRLLETGLTIDPAASVRWLHDVFGNSVAIAEFAEQANELLVVSTFRAEHYPLSETAVNLEDYARHYPFSYDALEIPDIGRTVERHYPDPEHRIDTWARGFVEQQTDGDTMGILLAMVGAIHQNFYYNRRDEMGTQDPLVTLNSGADVP